MREIYMSIKDDFRTGLHERLKTNPELMRICLDEFDYQSKGLQILDKNGPEPISYRDIIMQSHINYTDHITAGYVSHVFNILLEQGDAAFFNIHIGQIPLPDKYVHENKKLLTHIHKSFSVDLICKTYDHDGYLSWSPECEDSPNNIHPAFNRLTGVPLEIGRCNPETLYLHVLKYKGFARWPYGSKWIYVYGVESRALQNVI